MSPAGTRGALWTFGRRGTPTTVGLPSTGLSYSTALPLSVSVNAPTCPPQRIGYQRTSLDIKYNPVKRGHIRVQIDRTGRELYDG